MSHYKVVFLIMGILSAMQSKSQVQFGFTAGIDASTVKFQESDNLFYSSESYWKRSFHLGMFTSIELLENRFFLRPSIIYRNRGYNLDIMSLVEGMCANCYSMEAEGFARRNFHYLEIPIEGVLRQGSFCFSFGPYVAASFKGTFKHKFTLNHPDLNGTIESSVFYDEEMYELSPVFGAVNGDDLIDKWDLSTGGFNHYNAFDFGLVVGAGFQRDNFALSCQYSNGFKNLLPISRGDDELANLINDNREKVKATNRAFSISLNYFFSFQQD